jgi:HPt (histidine-containing phosphotransfer) domain-containing protein
MPDYRKAGFAGLIVKPIDEDQFWQLIDRYIQRTDGVSFAELSGRLDKVKQSLLPELLQELPEHAQQIQQAFEAREHDRLVDHLHQLKGVSGYFKLSTLSAIVAGAERYVRDARITDWDELAPLIHKLRE